MLRAQVAIALALVMRRVAAGDFSQQSQGPVAGALAPVWQAGEAVSAVLSQVVAQVKSEGVVVASEGTSLLARARDLAARTQQQAVGLEESVAAVQQLSESVARSAQAVGEVNGLATQVRDAATLAQAAMTQAVAGVSRIDAGSQRVAQTVAHARLRQGTADEAHALVLRALERVQAVGREQAFREFHDPKAGYIDRDLYLIVADRAGRYAVFGARPEMVGRFMSELPHFDAASFLADASARAEAGGGWVEFVVVHPATGTVQEKISWFMALGDDLLIGCGVFKRAVE